MSVPRLSVVVAGNNACRSLARCLAALAAQPDRADMEIIVCTAGSDGSDALVARDYPDVHLIAVPALRSLPILRGRGIAASRGGVIAIVDPYAVVDPDWSSRLLAAHDAHTNWVIGGAVAIGEPDQATFSAWALFINEYGIFLPPVPAGPCTIVPGCNVSYKRAALFDGEHPRYPVFWKTFTNWDVAAANSQHYLAPDVCVSLFKPIPFGNFLRTRFDHGRCFAAMRVAGSSWWQRLLRALTTPLLPLLLTWRWARHYWPKRRYRRRFVQTLPLQLLLFANWAAGEATGYLFGGGDSCERLYY